MSRYRSDVKGAGAGASPSDSNRGSRLDYGRVIVRAGSFSVAKVAEEEKKAAPTAETSNIMPPATAAPFLTWHPLLLHPWGPALLPGAWCTPAAIRSALPGLV